MRQVFYSIAGFSLAFSASACSSEPDRDSMVATPAEDSPVVNNDSGEGVANLPYARGRVFYSLDEYLAYLEEQGAIDLPWWRQIRPGVYEKVTTMTGAEPETATREEIMRMYGFER